jgi:long-chain acyl-CoA synthetase
MSEHVRGDYRSDTGASVAEMFMNRVRATPNREAYRYPTDGDWTSLTWQQTAEMVRDYAAGLISLGIEPEQRVGIASLTRMEWVLADLAIMCAAGATTTVYQTTPVEDVVFILHDSETRVVFAEDDTQVEKILTGRERLPLLTHIVVFEGSKADGDAILTLDDLAARGKALLAEQPDVVDQRVAHVQPEHLATLIYTSGTTGRPKGVQLTNGNWVYEADAADQLNIFTPEDLQFLWLPLAHSFGKLLQVAQLKLGFPTAVDGRVEKIVDNLGEVRPTLMGAPPRIFEKVYAKVLAGVEEEGGAKLRIFHWAVGVGKRAAALRREGKPVPILLNLQYGIADRLVFAKLRERMGGRVKYFISGAAALNKEMGEWFDAAGITILEGYGLTETSAGTFVNRPESYRFGFIGEPVPGTEYRIDDDGELLIKGPGVMRGYHNMPEQTDEVFTADGYFRTGDIAGVEHGLVKITDRKKDLFKTSGGKYVAPSLIEASFKSICPYASQIVVHGDRRHFVSALVALDPESVQHWAVHEGIITEEQQGDAYAAVIAHPKTTEMVQRYIDDLNEHLPRWETIKKFTLLTADLTVEAGELTPSMKLKRKHVEQKYMEHLDSMYLG